MKKKINIRWTEPIYFMKLRLIYNNKYRIKILNHMIKKNIILDINMYFEYLNYTNPYEYIYPEERHIQYHQVYHRIQTSETNEDKETIFTRINSIIYYKLHTNGSLFFWELNHKYKVEQHG